MFGPGVRRCGRARDVPFCAQPDVLVLRPGERRSVEAWFRPSAATLEHGVLTVAGQGVVVAGQGVAHPLDCPTRYGFDPINPGTCASRTVTCTNQTRTPVYVRRVELGATASSAFRLAPLPVLPIVEPNARLEIEATFCPHAWRHYAAGIEVESVEGRQIVSLAGRGGGADIAVEPREIDFGMAALVAPSRRYLLVRNRGVEQLELRQIVVAGTAFRTASDLPDRLADQM